MMLNLDKRYQKMVQSILRKHLPNKKVWVYGSRIKDTAHGGSDLDLVIISHVSEKELSLVRNAFSESNIPILIDIFAWESIPDAFKPEIEKNHEVFSF